MPEHLSSIAAVPLNPTIQIQDENDALRLLSRSPHPYHRQKDELLDPSDKFPSSSHTLRSALRSSLDSSQPRSPTSFPAVSREPTPTSDSGTEADDEHFLKGLPAPKPKLHKGLRGGNEPLSGTSTPLPSSVSFEEEGRSALYAALGSRKDLKLEKTSRPESDASKRRRVVVRRVTEVLLLGTLGVLVGSNSQVWPVLRRWRIELYTSLAMTGALAALYPLRLIIWGYWHRSPTRRIPLYVPLSFDPAPLLYPMTMTLSVSFLISGNMEKVVLPNIMLSICCLPGTLFPSWSQSGVLNLLQWLASCVPLLVSRMEYSSRGRSPQDDGILGNPFAIESLILLCPLHQSLCTTLHSFTTTSLLDAELQLLSVALIDVLLLSNSPQLVIIKAMLWVGGLDILVLCTRVILWGVSLARVPKWRFKRAEFPSKRSSSVFSNIMSWRRVRHDLFHAPMDSSSCSSCEAMDDHNESDNMGNSISKGLARVKTTALDGAASTGLDAVLTALDQNRHDFRSKVPVSNQESSHRRRHTLPFIDRPLKRSHTHTPSGRRKRSASSSVRAFFSLTQAQATSRKWCYAIYVYICVIGAIFVPSPLFGVKSFVQEYALHGYEPVGWALGYLFGDLPWFRWQVVSHNLERWICLPPRPNQEHENLGFIPYLRHSIVGEANTRLLLCAYYLPVIACGLLVVFRLSPFYEVDTRRKVFHFMMVAMFAPSIYIDPTFVALALSIVLTLFLLLDLLRASQLPPLSKPLASFLAPYVDGRDLRGPVVISHIFLLIGCAIPLWLSLGSLPRTGSGYLEGWEVPTREVSMVSGVLCVGLGDAAASLIGRRYGRRKWLWGGGKSLEGSVAFAIAVFLGLLAAHIWLRVGGWASTTLPDTLPVTLVKSGFCAGMASLTEAVLTGGNDNVVVPVILWTCVKSIGI